MLLLKISNVKKYIGLRFGIAILINIHLRLKSPLTQQEFLTLEKY